MDARRDSDVHKTLSCSDYYRTDVDGMKYAMYTEDQSDCLETRESETAQRLYDFRPLSTCSRRSPEGGAGKRFMSEHVELFQLATSKSDIFAALGVMCY